MSDIAERVKKIVVEHLGVDETKVTEKRQLHRRSGRRQPRHRRAGHGVRRGIRVEIPDDAAEKILTVKDAIKFIESTLTRSSAGVSHAAPARPRRGDSSIV